jgi:predicted RNase H-like HicB family nuclease/predicted RNA binding protein YcfA (HicA-like mRNA interferase family)
LKKQLTITIEKESDSKTGYFAFCRDLPGCFSNGQTQKETLENMREAVALHLESLQTIGNPEFFIDKSTVPQVVKFLEGQCFVPLRKSGNHLTIFKTIYEGKRPIRNVMISLPVHKTPDLGRKLTLQILKESGCSTDNFLK